MLVVEHDADMISAADEVVDIGPGAGENGGRVVFQGSVPAKLNSVSTIPGSMLVTFIPLSKTSNRVD